MSPHVLSLKIEEDGGQMEVRVMRKQVHARGLSKIQKDPICSSLVYSLKIHKPYNTLYGSLFHHIVLLPFVSVRSSTKLRQIIRVGSQMNIKFYIKVSRKRKWQNITKYHQHFPQTIKPSCKLRSRNVEMGGRSVSASKIPSGHHLEAFANVLSSF